MYLGRVVGRVVATIKSPGLAGVAIQLLQPLGEDLKPDGEILAACDVAQSGPGDLVYWIDGREAALACPETFVPVDAAILGHVEQVASTPRRKPRAPRKTAEPKAAAAPKGGS